MCPFSAAELQEETFEAQWSGTKKPSKPGVPHQAYFSVLPAGKNALLEKKKLPERHTFQPSLWKLCLPKGLLPIPFKGKINPSAAVFWPGKDNSPEDPNSPTTSSGYPSHKLRSMFLISKKNSGRCLELACFFLDLMNSHKVFFGGISRKVEAIHI